MDTDAKNPANPAALSLEELVPLIEYHNDRYWSQGAPEISDDAYDLLLMELRKRDPDHRLLRKVHSARVVSGGKVKLAEPMLSLDKAYSMEEVLAWAKKYARTPDELLLAQPKYDGISANFDGSILATRGDGETGEDVTAKIPLIELETVNHTGRLDRPARGEIVIRDDDFSAIYSHITKKGGGTYKNSRNAVSGIMGLKDISDMLRQHAKLTLVDYDLISTKIKLNELAARFPQVVAEIEALPYPTDGVVFKLADRAYSDSLGATSHHPRGQIAFKFSGIRRTTELVGVEWSFGKSALTPVALLDPVEIGGVTIKRATLHNAQNVIDKDLKIHDRVVVERAGDVIPYIVSGEAGENRLEILIENCPCCGAKLTMSGPELVCSNPDCFETNLQKLLASVKNLGIEQLGEPTLRKMMTTLNVKTLADVLEVTESDILKLENFAEKSAANLAENIASARENTDDYQFLAALNIPHVGPNIAKVLLKHYRFEQLASLTEEELLNVPTIGGARAKELATALRANADEITRLLSLVNLKRADAPSAGRPTVCFTGKMPEKRSYYEQLAHEHGYEPADSVTASLTLLVTAEADHTSTKCAKALKLGVKILTLNEFLQQLSALPSPDASATAAPPSPPPPKEEEDLFGTPKQLELDI